MTKDTILLFTLLLAASIGHAAVEPLKPCTPATFAGDEGTKYARLLRNRLKNEDSPFFRSIFMTDEALEGMPEGGRKALAKHLDWLQLGPKPKYWGEEYLADFDPNSENVLYRALGARIDPLLLRRRFGRKPDACRQGVTELYFKTRGTVPSAHSAELGSACLEHMSFYSDDHDLRTRIMTNLVEDVVQVVLDPKITDSNTVERVSFLIVLWGLDESPELLSAMERHADEVDPWLLTSMRGTVAYRKAWKARGTGYAPTVTDKGWREFGKYFAEAERHLRQAFSMRPDLYQSSVRLVRLECPSAPAEERDKWLRTAFAVRPDNVFALRNHLFHNLPRWGGSIEFLEQELDRLAPVDGDYSTRIPALNVYGRWHFIAGNEYDGVGAGSRTWFFTHDPKIGEKTLRVIRAYLQPGSSLERECAPVRDDLLISFISAACALDEYELAFECYQRLTPGVWENRFDFRSLINIRGVRRVEK